MNENNANISEILRKIAIVYTLQNKDRFRIIAYQKAAEIIQFLNSDIKELFSHDAIPKIEGVGENLSSHLKGYFKDPESSYFQKVLNEIPSTVFLLMNIPGVGPKKAHALVEAFHLYDEKTAIEGLKKAASDGKIAPLDRFGSKSEKEIIKALGIYETHQNKEKRVPYPIAFDLANLVIKHLKKNKHVKKVDAMGSLRRRRDTIGDVDIAATCDVGHEQEIVDHFVSYPEKIGIEGKGNKKGSIIAGNGMGIDFRIANSKSYGSMLQYFTGSKVHNIKLREYALKKGFSLSEWGIMKIKKSKSKIKKLKATDENAKVKEFADEKSFYHYLGLDYIEPELREGRNEINLALHHKLPHLVTINDIKGDFHFHSNYPVEPSHDLGANTPEDMIKKGLKKGYEYMGFSEHNPSQVNHTEKEILAILEKRYDHMKKIFSKKDFSKINCYIGLEVDILPNGNLALPLGAEEFLDYIIVSIHSRFDQSQGETTSRILKALEFPKVKIIGHPTGRLIEKRDGINADWEKIFKMCAEKNIACEINSSPYRLDLPDNLVILARENGVSFFIDSDAHMLPDMNNLEYGISVARRGFLEKKNVVNSWSPKELDEFFRK